MFALIEKYMTEGLAVLLALALALAGLQTLRLAWSQNEVAKIEKEDADAQADAAKKAKDTEEKLTAAANAASTAYEQGKQDASTTSTTLFADLAAARKQLRPVWVCPATGVPQAGPAPAEPSDAERQRDESAARIVGAAAECDAHVSSLLKFIDDQRTLINGQHD